MEGEREWEEEKETEKRNKIYFKLQLTINQSHYNNLGKMF